MPRETLEAWLSLYAAVGLLVVLTAILAAIKKVHDYASRSSPLPLATWPDRLLALPKVWLRWQMNYLLGMPTILGIAALYGHHLGFEVLTGV